MYIGDRVPTLPSSLLSTFTSLECHSTQRIRSTQRLPVETWVPLVLMRVALPYRSTRPSHRWTTHQAQGMVSLSTACSPVGHGTWCTTAGGDLLSRYQCHASVASGSGGEDEVLPPAGIAREATDSAYAGRCLIARGASPDSECKLRVLGFGLAADALAKWHVIAHVQNVLLARDALVLDEACAQLR